jgi:hypothetical protein
MGYRPVSRMDALLDELCVSYGWCLGDEDRSALIADRARDRHAIADAIIRAEFGEAGVGDDARRVWLLGLVDDWLFDRRGRGERSGLPL